MSEIIPAGFYKARAVEVVDEEMGPTKVRFGYSSQKSTPQCVVTFEIVDGDHAGKRVTWFGFFTDKTEKRTIESLRLLGFTGDNLMEAVGQALDNEVSITVEHENDDKGNRRARVAWVNDPNGGGFKMANPMGRDGLRQFSAQMRSKVASVQAGQRQASGSRSNGGGQQSLADDDIPFDEPRR